MLNITEELYDCFKLFQFEEGEPIPQLKEVRRRFFRMAKECHPDKNSYEDEECKKRKEEQFKSILNAYNEIADFLSNNVVIEEEDEEEIVARAEFKEANRVNLNLKSVTIIIPTAHADAWKEILKNTIGIKADRSESHNGIQFKTNDGINITLWKKKKEDTSTIMIDGKKGFLDFL